MKKFVPLLALCLTTLLLPSCSPAPLGSASGNADSSSVIDTSSPADDAESLLAQIDTVTLDGQAVSSTELAGQRLTVLNIWATWCPPCVAELPHLQQVSQEYADQGVAIVGVLQDGVDKNLAPADHTILAGQALLAEAGATYPVILPDQAIAQTLISQMQYFPTTFFLDAEGVVVKMVIGSTDTEGWRAEIENVLAQLDG